MLSNPCRLEPASVRPPAAPPLAPSLPGALTPLSGSSALCSARLPGSSPSCLSSLPPPTVSPWLSPAAQTGATVATYRRQTVPPLCGPLRACSCSLACAQSGWEDGREEGGGREDLLLYSLLLPVRGLWGEEFLCAAFPIPLSLLLLHSVTAGALSWLREERAEGTLAGGREAGGGDHTTLQLGRGQGAQPAP